MRRGLRALLEGVIDYAGLFPPAKLELDAAIRNYAKYQGEPESWMLGRFICPVAKLPELLAYRDLFSAERPLRISALVPQAENADAVLDGDAAALRAMSAFEQQASGWARVESREVKVPAGGGHEAAPGGGPGDSGLADGIRRFMGSVKDVDLPHLSSTFTEPAGIDEESIAVAVRACPRPGPEAARGAVLHEVGVKLRCGGVTPAAFPPPGLVARSMELCRDARVPLKFTAGLHHPIRHVDPGLQCHMHGFLNVFVAGVLAQALALEYHDILAIVEEEDVRQFRFDDEGLIWNEAAATVSEIEHARRTGVVSFGSCSFDEPREDLRRLDLL